jgi:hypothetical protein
MKESKDGKIRVSLLSKDATLSDGAGRILIYRVHGGGARSVYLAGRNP